MFICVRMTEVLMRVLMTWSKEGVKVVCELSPVEHQLVLGVENKCPNAQCSIISNTEIIKTH